MLLYVLGAGFTRSFVASAPLMDGFLSGFEDCLRQAEFGAVQRFMEKCRFESIEKTNIETVMTLADARDPEASEQLKRLIVKVLAHSLRMIEFSRNDESWYRFDVPEKEHILTRFARYLLGVSTQAHVLTFNYDVLLENALEVQQEALKARSRDGKHRRFHAGRCHGFLAHTWRKGGGIRPQSEKERPDHVLVLKLHGSMLWRVPADPSDRRVVALSAHETNIRKYSKAENTIHREMDGQPLIVPPVLDKAKELRHPDLKQTWDRAEGLIAQAERILFIGYSFPATDYEAEYLFRANHCRGCKIEIINRCEPPERERLCQRYDSVFPDCPRIFHWGDAATELEKLLPD